MEKVRRAIEVAMYQDIDGRYYFTHTVGSFTMPAGRVGELRGIFMDAVDDAFGEAASSPHRLAGAESMR